MTMFWFALTVLFGSMSCWMAVIITRRDRVADALKMECAVAGVVYLQHDPKLTLKRLIDWHVDVEREHMFVGSVCWTSQEAFNFFGASPPGKRDHQPPN